MSKLKIKTPQRAARCIFCGSTGLSKEHLWADWISDLVTTLPRQGRTMELKSTNPIHPPKIITRHRQGNPIITKVRAVCRTCNNGWMSILEKKTKPILEPLIRAEKCILTEANQRILCRWIAKTTMVSEFAAKDPEHVAIPQSERSNIMDGKEVADIWQIYLLSISGPKKSTNMDRVTATLSGPEVELKPPYTKNTQATFMGIGRFAFYAISCADPDSGINLENWDQDHLPRLYPFTGASIPWPPANGDFSDRGVDRFVAQFGEFLRGGSWHP